MCNNPVQKAREFREKLKNDSEKYDEYKKKERKGRNGNVLLKSPNV